MFRPSISLWLGGCFCFYFCFGASHGAIMPVVATGTTISCSQGRRYGPVLSLSFLDVYGAMTGTPLGMTQHCCHQHFIEGNS
jgi:hypothetical protein